MVELGSDSKQTLCFSFIPHFRWMLCKIKENTWKVFDHVSLPTLILLGFALCNLYYKDYWIFWFNEYKIILGYLIFCWTVHDIRKFSIPSSPSQYKLRIQVIWVALEHFALTCLEENILVIMGSILTHLVEMLKKMLFIMLYYIPIMNTDRTNCF